MKITALLLACSGAQAFTSVSNNMRISTAVSSTPTPDQSWFFQHNGSIGQTDHYAAESGPDNWMYDAWGGIGQTDFAAKATGEDDWCYQPWSGIKQEDFYPVSQAANQMMSAPNAAQPAVPPPAPQMPEQAAPEVMPEQAMPQMQNAGVGAQA
ncbi:MAG: hypothetical protein SGBAC_009299 [Bacillariaceae sp.]